MKADKSTMATIRRVTIGNMSRGCSDATSSTFAMRDGKTVDATDNGRWSVRFRNPRVVVIQRVKYAEQGVAAKPPGFFRAPRYGWWMRRPNYSLNLNP